MTSVFNSASTSFALQTLRSINADLNKTSNIVSSGLVIAQASDSPSYWAIATQTRSDTGALGTVLNAISVGSATLDVANNGLSSVRSSLDSIKNLLITARQPGADRASLQSEIDGFIDDMLSKAGASVINEQNLLSVDTDAADYNATQQVVASFDRSGSATTISTIDIDISDVALIDADSADDGKTGILDQSRAGLAQTTDDGGVVRNGILALRSYDDGTASPAMPLGDLTDSVPDLTTIDNMISGVDAILSEVIAAETKIGANLARAESQEAFVSSLIDAKERAVSALVDANVEEQSTKLRALQAQQQLAIEALSIANSSAANVLNLFR